MREKIMNQKCEKGSLSNKYLSDCEATAERESKNI